MSRPPKIRATDLSTRLMSAGPMSAAALAAAFRVDRSTVVRKLRDLGGRVAVFGATRRTRYALRREIRGAGDAWPVHRIDETGRARLWGGLEAFHGAWRFTFAGTPPAWAAQFSDPEGLWDGFPFFLGDLRPQGFLGRLIARQLSRTLLVPEDPRAWSDDDTLLYLHAFGENLPGDLVPGDDGLRRALADEINPPPKSTIEPREAPDRYPELARQALDSPPPGSSAGGEQPKFLATLTHPGTRHRHVLVKFSPPLAQDTGRRWADLLLAEFHALAILADLGFARSGHRVIDAGGRRFLEIPRFDRTGSGGRRGIVSLEALHAAAIGSAPADWTSRLLELSHAGLCSAESVGQTRRLQAFGEMIGNTDMHAGNLAFMLRDELPFAPTPAYDMLPMLWAPGPQGELAAPRFAPMPPAPADAEAWREMHRPALEFWTRLLEDPRLSPEFASIARLAREDLEKAIPRS